MSVLDALGVDVPDAMNGTEVTSSGGRAFDRRVAEHLADTNTVAVFRDRTVGPLTTVYVILQILTYVAAVVEVEVDDKGRVRIPRVDIALDAGTIINPDRVKAQFEGAAVMGTSLALYGEITATNGAVDQSNFDTFQMARMNNAPRETNIYIVPSDAPPAGIGEPGLPPFAPALCNAIFAATGKRVRELPLSRAGLA